MTCLICSGATDLYLCSEHRGRLAATLRAVPAALAELQTAIARQTRMAPSSGGSSVCDHSDERACACGVRLPWDERASHAADQLRGAVHGWTRIVLEESGLPPDTATTPQDLAQSIACRDWADLAYTEITQRETFAWRIVDRAEDRLYAGVCGGRLVLPEIGATECTRRLWAKPQDTAITCRTCGTITQVADRQAVMLAAAEDLHLNARECAVVLTTILRVRVPAGTIRSWASRGHLAPVESGERTLYRLGDVLACHRSMAMAGRSLTG